MYKKNNLGVLGVFIGFLGMFAIILNLYLFPAETTKENSVKEKILITLKSKLDKKESSAPPYLSYLILLLGASSMLLGFISYLKNEKRKISLTSELIGAGVVIVQLFTHSPVYVIGGLFMVMLLSYLY